MLATTLISTLSLFATSCGETPPAAVTATPSATPAAASDGFALSSFSPASGTVTIPTSVQITFNESLNASVVAADFTWTCANGTAAGSVATAISISGATVTVTLPAVTGTGSSTSCTLSLANIEDVNGDLLATSPTAVFGAAATTTTSTTQNFVGYFTNPVANQVVMGNLPLSVSVFNAVGNTTVSIASIQFVIDSIALPTVAYTGLQLSTNFNSNILPNGSHTVHLYAYDTSGVQYVDIATPVTITISNLTGNLAQLCSNYAGYAALDGTTPFCVVNASSCPSGMVPYGDGKWTITKSVSCDGGTTTKGCINPKTYTGNTGYHSYLADIAPETVTVKTLSACGPATQGSKTCTAEVLAIGCTLAP